MIRLISVLVLVIVEIVALSGCTQTYYRPQAAEGRIADATCPPAPSIWLLERDGVVVGSRAHRRDGGYQIDMYFEISEGRSAKLLSHQLVVVTPDERERKLELSGRVMISMGKSRELEVGELLTGASKGLFKANYTPYYGVDSALYWYSASFDSPGMDEFLIRLPLFLVNGNENSAPEIVFKLDSETHFVPTLNC